MHYSILTSLTCCLSVAQGFQTPTIGSKSAFVWGSASKSGFSRDDSNSLKMDLEEPFSSKTRQDLMKRYIVSLPSLRTTLQIPKSNHVKHKSIDQALEQHGMPWMSSIDPTYPADPERGLFYMPFFEWQLQFMKDNLNNLRIVPTESKTGQDLSYIESRESPVRMVTLCFASDEYRKIRMTVYDAGNRTQVFTSLWYPQPEYNLPVLGTDLLQFHHDRHLCVVDFQPIQGAEEDHAQPYEHLLEPIRNRYPSLQGQMTKRFYDESQFFSNQMLYGRFEELHASPADTLDGHPAYRDLFPAYQQYVQTHLKLIHATQPQPEAALKVLEGQAAYDTYSADRDPAHAMFAKVFGPEFADAFVYDVLFSYSNGNQRRQ